MWQHASYTDVSGKKKAYRNSILNSVNLSRQSQIMSWKISCPFKIYMYLQKFFKPAISAKTIWHAHPTLKKAIDNAQKIEREFLLVEGIQQTEFDTVMSIQTSAGNDPLKQQTHKHYMLHMLTERSLQERLH